MNIPSMLSMPSLPTAAAVVSALGTVADAAVTNLAGSISDISNRPDFRDANDDQAIEGSALEADLRQQITNYQIGLGVVTTAAVAGAAYAAYKNWETIKSGAATVASFLSCSKPSCLQRGAGSQVNANAAPTSAVAPGDLPV